MSKMYDAGETRDQMYGEDMPMMESGGKSKKDTKKYYPDLDLDSNQFPEIPNLKVGETVMLCIQVKPTRYSINEKEGNEPKSNMCFDILQIGVDDDQNEPADKKVDNMVSKMYPDKKTEVKK